MKSKLTKSQKETASRKYIGEDGKNYQLKIEIRYDDECGNGHNSFAITAENYLCDVKGNPVRWDSGGCLHEDIVKVFPDYAHLIKWHLCSSDGPMHYIANTVHFASERDCWGLLKGEPKHYDYGLRFNNVPVTHRLKKSFYEFLEQRAGKEGRFTIAEFAHDREPKTYGSKYTLTGYADKWHECPFDDKTEAEEFCEALNTCQVSFVKVPSSWGEGKERELDSARHAAIWPDATDEELTAPGLEERLKARLPKLLEDFRKDIEALGFVF